MEVVPATGASLLVTEGTLALPFRGVWMAEVVVASLEASFSGPATLRWAGETFTGTLSTMGTDGRARVRGRIVGGAGALSTEVPAKGYFRSTLRSVLSDALGTVGERLSASSSAEVLSTALGFWARQAGPAVDTLGLLAELAAADWRTLPDGSVWIGKDLWLEAPVDQRLVLLAIAREQARRDFSTYTAKVRPGMTLLGERVASVEYAVKPDQHRMTVWGGE